MNGEKIINKIIQGNFSELRRKELSFSFSEGNQYLGLKDPPSTQIDGRKLVMPGHIMVRLQNIGEMSSSYRASLGTQW